MSTNDQHAARLASAEVNLMRAQDALARVSDCSIRTELDAAQLKIAHVQEERLSASLASRISDPTRAQWLAKLCEARMRVADAIAALVDGQSLALVMADVNMAMSPLADLVEERVEVGP